MAILLTGGAGFIGSHVAERLVKAGQELVVLDNLDPYYGPEVKRRNISALLGSPRFRFVEGDIRDGALLGRLAREVKFEMVIHLAARAGVRASLREPVLCADVNVNGTLRLLELAREHGIPRFIFASSSSVYGERNRIPFHEDDAIDRPSSPYAATKAAGEMLCWTYHHLFGLHVSCLRFFTVYGPRQRPEMAIHLFTRLINDGEEVPIFGDGSARRDFTYIDDIVMGVMAAAERCAGFRVYNLGNSSTVSVGDLVGIISGALGKPARMRTLPREAGDVSITYADIDRARKELGYSPSTPISLGIPRFIEWYRALKNGMERG